MAETAVGGVPQRGAASRRRGAGTSDALASLGRGTGASDAVASPGRGAGTSDARAARARELHRKAVEADALAAQFRAERDSLIKRLRAEDPQRWSYGALAAVIGCSRELIALVSKRA